MFWQLRLVKQNLVSFYALYLIFAQIDLENENNLATFTSSDSTVPKRYCVVCVAVNSEKLKSKQLNSSI